MLLSLAQIWSKRGEMFAACAVMGDHGVLLLSFPPAHFSQMLDKDTLTGVGDHTRVGSPLFMAPEILLREEYGPPVVSRPRFRSTLGFLGISFFKVVSAYLIHD